MRVLPITRLKAELSEHLRHVKEGEEIIVTERGRPVARLVPIEAGEEPEADLADLEAAGLVRSPRSALPAGFWKEPTQPDDAASLRAAVIEDRAAGW